MIEAKFHGYLFGNMIGRPFLWFAWYPVRTQAGQLVWLRRVYRQRVVKKPWLDGPDWEFFAHSLEVLE